MIEPTKVLEPPQETEMIYAVETQIQPTPAETATTPPEPTATLLAPPPVILKPGQIKIVIFVGITCGGINPEQQPVHAQIQNEFNASHTDIQIEFQIVDCSNKDPKEWFSSLLAEDNAPDIVWLNGVAGIAIFYDKWLDLTPFIQADNYDLRRFIGSTAKANEYPDKGLLGLPVCVFPAVVYYNSDLFDAANLDYPPHKFGEKYADGESWTYDKLVEIARKITTDANGNDADSPAFDPDNTKVWGFEGWGGTDLTDFAQKFGPENGMGVSLDRKKAILNSQTYIDAMEFEKKLTWEWHTWPTFEQYANIDQSSYSMGSGRIGMWEAQNWMGIYDAWDKTFNWDVAAIPSVGSNKIISTLDMDGVAIPKGSHHPKEAWEVVKWLLDKTNLKRLADNYDCMPSDKDLATEWKVDQSKKRPNVDFQVFLDALDYADTPNHEQWKPDYENIDGIIGKTEIDCWRNPNCDVKSTLNAANAEVQKLLDDYWASH